MLSCPCGRASSHAEGIYFSPHVEEPGFQWPFGVGTTSAIKFSAPQQGDEDTSGEQTYCVKKSAECHESLKKNV